MKDNNNYKYTRKYTKACHHIFMESIKVYSKLNKTGLFIIPFCFTHYFIPEYSTFCFFTLSVKKQILIIFVSLFGFKNTTPVSRRLILF